MPPSQSSSWLLHVSGIGPTAPTHEPQAPPEQVCVPATHAPTSVPHGCVAPLVHEHPSSTTPSQSSSIKLQVSVPGPTDPPHTPHAPAKHPCVPDTHAPTSVPHAWINASS